MCIASEMEIVIGKCGGVQTATCLSSAHSGFGSRTPTKGQLGAGGGGTKGTALRERDHGHHAGLFSVFLQRGWIREVCRWVLALRGKWFVSADCAKPGRPAPCLPFLWAGGQLSTLRWQNRGHGVYYGSFRLLPRSRERALETSNLIFSLSGTF